MLINGSPDPDLIANQINLFIFARATYDAFDAIAMVMLYC